MLIHRHVLASGSADNTVLLWDLDQGSPHTKLDYFEDKVRGNITEHSLIAVLIFFLQTSKKEEVFNLTTIFMCVTS